MDLKEFDFNKLETKQKIMIPVGVILALVVAWQAYAMFGGGDEIKIPPPAPVQVAAKSAGPTNANEANAGPGAAAGPTAAGVSGTMGQMQAPVVPVLEEVKPLPPSADELAELENAKQMRRIYLTLLQQYQIASVQRLLAETRANIASSEANLAQQRLEKARSEAQSEQISGGGVPGGTPGKIGPSGEFTPGIPAVAQAPVDEGPSEKYTVSYIGQQRGQWSAILMYENKPVDVVVGSRLGDDSEVMAINSQTVLLAKNMKRRLIQLPTTSMTLLKAPTLDESGQQTNDISPNNQSNR